MINFNISEFISVHCTNFTNGQQLHKQLDTKDINTLIIDGSNLYSSTHLHFPPNFIEELNIANLVLLYFFELDNYPLNFNVTTLKEVTFQGANYYYYNVNQKAYWQLFNGSSVKSLNINVCCFKQIDREFGEIFKQLEFVTFDTWHASQIEVIETKPIKNKVNAFEMIHKLKFLKISRTNIIDVNWLFKSNETDQNGNPVQVGSYPSLERLDLSWNKIETILNQGFTQKRFPKLKYLNLRQNKIYSFEYIEKLMFNQFNELWIDKQQQDKLSQEIGPNDKVKVFYT